MKILGWVLTQIPRRVVRRHDRRRRAAEVRHRQMIASLRSGQQR